MRKHKPYGAIRIKSIFRQKDNGMPAHEYCHEKILSRFSVNISLTKRMYNVTIS